MLHKHLAAESLLDQLAPGISHLGVHPKALGFSPKGKNNGVRRVRPTHYLLQGCVRNPIAIGETD